MQGNKINILVTGPLQAYLAEEAEANHIHTDIIQFIKTEAIQTIEIQQEIEQALLRTATVVFTSRHAVDAVAAELEGQEPDWNIYCVGMKTSQLAAGYFGEERILGTANDAEELAELIIEEGITEEVIFFCGDQRRDELPDLLRNSEIGVNEITVYHTIAVPQKLTGRYDGILFFSPSGVASFFSVNRIDDTTVLFAIGNTTSNAIRQYAGNKIIISKTPDKEQMIREVVNFFL